MLKGLDKNINFRTKEPRAMNKKIKAIKESCVAGKTIEHVIKLPSGNHKGKRQRRLNLTPEAVKKNNDRIAERTLRRLINANCDSSWGLYTFTYTEEPELAEAIKDRRALLRIIRTKVQKNNSELKYIAVTESDGCRIHHHILMNTLDLAMVKAAWPKGHIVDLKLLDDSGNYKRIAGYLIKETNRTFRAGGELRQRYSTSRNLIRPIVKKEEVSIKCMYEEPEATPGYYIDRDSDITYRHPVTGLPHREYIEIKNREQLNGVTLLEWPNGRICTPERKYTAEYQEEQLAFSIQDSHDIRTVNARVCLNLTRN